MAKKKDDTWIKLNRSLMSHKVWLGEPFTRGQAWVDLLMMACYADTDTTYNGKVIHVKRGQIRTSIRYLAKRWKRSVGWVDRTLKTLKMLKMCDTNGYTDGTLITIENYAKFQSGRTQTETPMDTRTDTRTDTGNKNIKKNIYKKEAPAAESETIKSLSGDGENEEERFIWVPGTNGQRWLYDTEKEEYVE